MGDILTDELIEGKITTEDIYNMSDDPWSQTQMLCREKQQIIKFLPEYVYRFKRCKKIMDLGCGLGIWCFFIKNQTFYREIIGIDNSQTAIEKAGKNFSTIPEISFDVVDCGERGSLMKLKKHSPDVILMSDITWCLIHTIVDFKRHLRENHRGKYLIHVLQVPHFQEYTTKITDHESILKFFNFDYIFDGTFYKEQDDDIKYVSYFLARIK